MGKLFLVGIGPGNEKNMTQAALDAIDQAEVICGYTMYVQLLGDRIVGKEIYTTGMTQELERCRWALRQAAGGKSVAMICSGDAGIYGMEGPVLKMLDEAVSGTVENAAGREKNAVGTQETAEDRDNRTFGALVDVEIIPGITAAIGGAALLGAPLMHDFCVISLSDLLTPWELIQKRLRCAAEGDFSIALYNPSSHKRPDHLKRACDILLEYKSPDTVCGYVRNIGRAGQESEITTLRDLRELKLDMFCTVFIGNSSTAVRSGRMVTPRGYEGKL